MSMQMHYLFDPCPFDFAQDRLPPEGEVAKINRVLSGIPALSLPPGWGKVSEVIGPRPPIARQSR